MDKKNIEEVYVIVCPNVSKGDFYLPFWVIMHKFRVFEVHGFEIVH